MLPNGYYGNGFHNFEGCDETDSPVSHDSLSCSEMSITPVFFQTTSSLSHHNIAKIIKWPC